MSSNTNDFVEAARAGTEAKKKNLKKCHQLEYLGFVERTKKRQEEQDRRREAGQDQSKCEECRCD
jgi:hypothetical protein